MPTHWWALLPPFALLICGGWLWTSPKRKRYLFGAACLVICTPGFFAAFWAMYTDWAKVIAASAVTLALVSLLLAFRWAVHSPARLRFYGLAFLGLVVVAGNVATWVSH